MLFEQSRTCWLDLTSVLGWNATGVADIILTEELRNRALAWEGISRLLALLSQLLQKVECVSRKWVRVGVWFWQLNRLRSNCLINHLDLLCLWALLGVAWKWLWKVSERDFIFKCHWALWATSGLHAWLRLISFLNRLLLRDWCLLSFLACKCPLDDFLSFSWQSCSDVNFLLFLGLLSLGLGLLGRLLLFLLLSCFFDRLVAFHPLETCIFLAFLHLQLHFRMVFRNV